MSQLLSKLHLLIIALLLWFAWGDYSEFLENEELKRSDKETLDLQITRAKSKVGEINVYKKNLERSRQKLKEVRGQITDLKDKLPSERNDTELLNFLSDQSDRIRLIDPSFKSLGEKNKELYFAEQYEVEAVGNFQQFLVYLEKLNDQARIYNVDFIEIRPEVQGEDNQRNSRAARSQKFQLLESKIILETYRFNQETFERSLVNDEEDSI